MDRRLAAFLHVHEAEIHFPIKSQYMQNVDIYINRTRQFFILFFNANSFNFNVIYAFFFFFKNNTSLNLSIV